MRIKKSVDFVLHDHAAQDIAIVFIQQSYCRFTFENIGYDAWECHESSLDLSFCIVWEIRKRDIIFLIQWFFYNI